MTTTSKRRRYHLEAMARGQRIEWWEKPWIMGPLTVLVAPVAVPLFLLVFAIMILMRPFLAPERRG